MRNGKKCSCGCEDFEVQKGGRIVCKNCGLVIGQTNRRRFRME